MKIHLRMNGASFLFQKTLSCNADCWRGCALTHASAHLQNYSEYRLWRGSLLVTDSIDSFKKKFTEVEQIHRATPNSHHIYLCYLIWEERLQVLIVNRKNTARDSQAAGSGSLLLGPYGAEKLSQHNSCLVLNSICQRADMLSRFSALSSCRLKEVHCFEHRKSPEFKRIHTVINWDPTLFLHHIRPGVSPSTQVAAQLVNDLPLEIWTALSWRSSNKIYIPTSSPSTWGKYRKFQLNKIIFKKTTSKYSAK